ncbi:MAG: hypothetical protein V4719_08335 [Planctomycetota bacterium]
MKRPQYSEVDFQTAASGIRPGPDLEWFAVDRELYVGGFCNAGFGCVPKSIFKSYQLFEDTLEAIASLPRTGDVTWVQSKHPNVETWDRWSQQGLFAYDWNHRVGQPDSSLPYRLMCCPEKPIHLSVFSPVIADYISQVHFKHLSFRDTRELFLEG